MKQNQNQKQAAAIAIAGAMAGVQNLAAYMRAIEVNIGRLEQSVKVFMDTTTDTRACFLALAAALANQPGVDRQRLALDVRAHFGPLDGSSPSELVREVLRLIDE